jgi:hypothetical protein
LKIDISILILKLLIKVLNRTIIIFTVLFIPLRVLPRRHSGSINVLIILATSIIRWSINLPLCIFYYFTSSRVHSFKCVNCHVVIYVYIYLNIWLNSFKLLTFFIIFFIRFYGRKFCGLTITFLKKFCYSYILNCLLFLLFFWLDG